MTKLNGSARAHQWKNAKRTEEVELPSGRTMLVQRPNLMSMVLNSGTVPDFMMGFIEKSFGGQKPKSDSMSQTIKQEDLPFLVELMNMAAIGCAVSPKVVRENPDYDADQIELSDLTDDEKTFLLGYALGGELASPQVAAFPVESNGSVDS